MKFRLLNFVIINALCGFSCDHTCNQPKHSIATEIGEFTKGVDTQNGKKVYWYKIGDGAKIEYDPEKDGDPYDDYCKNSNADAKLSRNRRCKRENQRSTLLNGNKFEKGYDMVDGQYKHWYKINDGERIEYDPSKEDPRDKVRQMEKGPFFDLIPKNIDY